MSKLRHYTKCYVQDIGFFSVPEGHSINQPYISKWFTASIWTQDVICYYNLNGLHFSNLWQQPEWPYKIVSVHPSVHLSICPSIGIVLLVISKFWHGTINLYEVVDDSRILCKKIFCPKSCKNGPKICQKQVFSNLLKNVY